MDTRNTPVTREIYASALKLVRMYQEQQLSHIEAMIPVIDAELKATFSEGGLVEWRTVGRWQDHLDRRHNAALSRDRDWERSCIVYTIYPIEPEFDESYSGEYEREIKAVADKLGIVLRMDLSAYGK